MLCSKGHSEPSRISKWEIMKRMVGSEGPSQWLGRSVCPVTRGEMFTQRHLSTSSQNSAVRGQNKASYDSPAQSCHCEDIQNTQDWTQTHPGMEAERTVLRIGRHTGVVVCIHWLSCCTGTRLLSSCLGWGCGSVGKALA